MRSTAGILSRRPLLRVLMASAFFGIAAACAVRSAPVPRGAAQVIVVDGEAVTVVDGSLLDFLRTRTSLRGFFAQSAQNTPLLVIDDAKLPGSLNRLGEINVRAVKRVTILRSPEAFARYGPDASNGAIVVETLERR